MKYHTTLTLLHKLHPLPDYFRSKLDDSRDDIRSNSLDDISDFLSLKNKLPFASSLAFYEEDAERLWSEIDQGKKVPMNALATACIFLSIAGSFSCYVLGMNIWWALINALAVIFCGIVLFVTFVLSSLPWLRRSVQIFNLIEFVGVVIAVFVFEISFSCGSMSITTGIFTKVIILQLLLTTPLLSVRFLFLVCLLPVASYLLADLVSVVFCQLEFRIDSLLYLPLLTAASAVLVFWRYLVEYTSRLMLRRKVGYLIEKKKKELVASQIDHLLSVSTTDVYNHVEMILSDTEGGDRSVTFEDGVVMFMELLSLTTVAENESNIEAFKRYKSFIELVDALVAETEGVSKIKTYGSSYLIAGGLGHDLDVVIICHNILLLALKLKNTLSSTAIKGYFNLRIGIARGPVHLCAFGYSGYTIDIWSNTVNLASRLCEYGGVGDVSTTINLFTGLEDDFQYKSVGEVRLKGIEQTTEVFLVEAFKAEETNLFVREDMPLRADSTKEQFQFWLDGFSGSRKGIIMNDALIFNRDRESDYYVLRLYKEVGTELAIASAASIDKIDIETLSQMPEGVSRISKLNPSFQAMRYNKRRDEYMNWLRKCFYNTTFLQFCFFLAYTVFFSLYLVLFSILVGSPFVRVVFLLIWSFFVKIPLLCCIAAIIGFLSMRSAFHSLYFFIFGVSTLIASFLTGGLFCTNNSWLKVVFHLFLGKNFYSQSVDPTLLIMAMLDIIIQLPILNSFIISSFLTSVSLYTLSLMLLALLSIDMVLLLERGIINAFISIVLQIPCLLLSYKLHTSIFRDFLIGVSLLSEGEDIVSSNVRKEDLLRSIAPVDVIEKPDHVYSDEGAILVADIVDFTATSQKLSILELVGYLETVFGAIDSVVCRYGDVRKLHTIGDAYVALAGLLDKEGLSDSNSCSGNDTIGRKLAQGEKILALMKCGEEIIRVIKKTSFKTVDGINVRPSIRIGIADSFLLGGLTGTSPICFNVFGSAVNDAFRLQSLGEESSIAIMEEALMKLPRELRMKFYRKNGCYLYRVEDESETKDSF